MNGSVVGPSAVNCTNHLTRVRLRRRRSADPMQIASTPSVHGSALALCCRHGNQCTSRPLLFSVCNCLSRVAACTCYCWEYAVPRRPVLKLYPCSLWLTNHPYGREASLRTTAMHQTELLSSFHQSPAELIVKRRTPTSSVT